MNSQCGIIASELQEFFDEEISVLFQDSDGFVVLHGMKDNSNLNTPLEEVIDEVMNNKDAFR